MGLPRRAAGRQLPLPLPSHQQYLRNSSLALLFEKTSKKHERQPRHAPGSPDSPRGCRAIPRCMLPVSTETWCSRAILLDYRKRVFDGSFQYGDGYNVSEKGVQTAIMSQRWVSAMCRRCSDGACKYSEPVEKCATDAGGLVLPFKCSSTP